MKKVTKQIAKEFAQKFFGTGKAKLNTLDDGVFSYQLGKITLEIFPFYGMMSRMLLFTWIIYALEQRSSFRKQLNTAH